jgi:predicted nicotinamide N-methyase
LLKLNSSSAVVNMESFIRGNMAIQPVPSVPEISLYTAHPGSRLGRLGNKDLYGQDHPPYWAYRWAGGTVLARYILDHPATVEGLRVLDLGTGAGLVGIAAAKAGAKEVAAVDIDLQAVIASRLNAQLNMVDITVSCADILKDEPPAVDLIAVGDLFYAAALAESVSIYLGKCADRGIKIIVGDPGREFLPRSRLQLLAEYPVPDFGGGQADAAEMSAVYRFEG